MFWGCFGAVRASHPTKNLRIRPLGYFFMLHSILKLPDLEIPLKSQKIQIFRFSLLCKIEKSKVFELRSNISGRPLGDRKLHAKNSDSQPPGGPGAPGIAKILLYYILGKVSSPMVHGQILLDL